VQHFYDRYRWAEDLFARDYFAAARVLEELLSEATERHDEAGTAFRVAEALGAVA